jgi:uncharacterized membrane protein YgcG
LVTSIAALAGTFGCAAPAVPKFGQAKQAVTGDVYNTPASKTTRAALGITRWHAIIEPKSGAVVIDGQDAKGNVKFVTAYRMDAATHTYRVESYVHKGVLAFDSRSGQIRTDSLTQPKAWAQATAAFATDWVRHRDNTAYSVANGYANGAIAIVGGVAAIGFAVVAAPLTAAVVTVGAVGAGAVAVVGGVVALVDNYQTNQEKEAAATQARTDSAFTDSKISALEQAQNGSGLKEALDAKAAEAAASEAKAAADGTAPAPDPAAPPADPGSTPAQGDPASQPSEPTQEQSPSNEPPQAQSLPPNDNGGNLDNGGGLDTTAGAPGGGADTPSGGSDTGGSDTGGSDTGASDTGGSSTGASDTGGGDTGASDTGGSDTGGSDTGGSDTGGGDTGGGDTSGSAEAVGICRRVAASKRTKVRACTHY